MSLSAFLNSPYSQIRAVQAYLKNFLKTVSRSVTTFAGAVVLLTSGNVWAEKVTEFVGVEEAALRACIAFVTPLKSPPESYCVPGASMYLDDPHGGAYRAGWFGNKYGTFGFCRAGTTFYADVTKCLGRIEVTSSPPHDTGKQCPSCGEPINPGNGNMWHVETDYSSRGPGGLSISRTYNSNVNRIDTSTSGKYGFGSRWSDRYNVRITRTVPVEAGKSDVRCWRREDSTAVECDPPVVSTEGLPPAMSVSRGDGKRFVFNIMNGRWVSSGDVSARLTGTLNGEGVQYSAWQLDSDNGDTEHFDSSGALIAIVDRSGIKQTLTYSDGITNDTSISRFPANAPACSNVQGGTRLPQGYLLCVTDSWGRQLQFEYDGKGRITKAITPTGKSLQYYYDGITGGCSSPEDVGNPACNADNLTSVVYEDGTTRTYHYNEQGSVNGGQPCTSRISSGETITTLRSLTGLTDENGTRHISWTYNCSGYATSSELAGGVNKVSIAYGDILTRTSNTPVVTHIWGTPSAPVVTNSKFWYAPVLGIQKLYGVVTQCPECGPVNDRAFDENGNVKTMTYRNGSITTFVYDLQRNLEISRVEGSGTAVARTITTEWHPSLPVVMAVAEPKLITRYTYVGGNVATKTQQATSDTTGMAGFAAVTLGGVRRWTYAYNTAGQIETITGPRTDVADVTTYTYDPATGALATITNALGHKTQFSAFTADGQAQRIVAPNGVVTTRAFDARGRLASEVTGVGEAALSTLFEYDNVGQIKKKTLPGGQVIWYDYDGAHRLIQIKDSLGNLIQYELDLRGNVIAEKTLDPQGLLTRQTRREFDVNGRMLKQTGAM